MRPRHRHIDRLASVAVLATLALIPACSSGAPPFSGPTVSVTLRDFKIEASAPTVAPGEVRFQVHNDGPSTHEFVVLRTDYPSGGLPLGSDGITVDEEAEGIDHVGEIQEAELGESQTLVLRLTPGNYVLFCNLEGHYLGGMRFPLKVSR